MLTYGGQARRLSAFIADLRPAEIPAGRQASAMSWLFLVFIFIISFFFIRELQRGE
jgi:hypothetical protein